MSVEPVRYELICLPNGHKTMGREGKGTNPILGGLRIYMAVSVLLLRLPPSTYDASSNPASVIAARGASGPPSSFSRPSGNVRGADTYMERVSLLGPPIHRS